MFDGAVLVDSGPAIQVAKDNRRLPCVLDRLQHRLEFAERCGDIQAQIFECLFPVIDANHFGCIGDAVQVALAVGFAVSGEAVARVERVRV